MQTTILVFLFCIFPTIGAAEVYRQIDQEGNVTFSDHRTQQSEKVTIPPVNVIKPYQENKINNQISQSDKHIANKSKKSTDYQQLILIHPIDDQTVRDDLGNVTLQWRSEPELATNEQHYFEVLLDGVAMGNKLEQTSITLNNIDRGTHTVQIQLLNSNGMQLTTSQAVTFHLHRFSRIRRAP